MEVLKPKIGVSAATFLVVSVIIGSGVFKKLAPMSQTLGSPLLVILCWVLAGLISLAGALSTAEMVSMFPNSGGEYFYFQKVYGRFFSFMYGWASFTVIKTASIAALAYIFAQSLTSLFPLPIVGDNISFLGIAITQALFIKLVASFLIIALTLLNYRGAQFASKLSTVLTYLMLTSIVAFLAIGFGSSQGSISNLTNTSHLPNAPDLSGFSLLKALFVASLGAFWGYEGWNGIAYIGEEIKNPKRNLPLALGIGTLIVMTAYVLLNIVFVYILPIDYFIQLTPNKIAAVEVAGKLSGHVGMVLVASLIVVTTLNATNSTILTSARMMYAMARDKLFFYKAANVHPKYNTPDIALFIQAFWAIALVFSGSFDQLTDMLVFASFIFYGSTALGVIILRVKHPEYERKYKVIGYPFVPGLFLLFCAALFVITIFNKPYEAIWGLSLIATGFPVYWYLNRK
ncbi:MAG: amino acid permease [Chitinophagia bacterium]|jgi:APA family basic amino acid/polyamine antiporter|nr:amino acid permease [Chitinophagia bacterium]NCA30669.1 amino acid permease [Chitinophagia bacterium]NDD16735.1 amino acid permease [Chitinophagia bacterium]